MRPTLPALPLVALPLLALVLAGCGAKADREIPLEDNAFVGGDQVLSAGTRVAFRNDGETLHQVSIHKAGEPVETLRLAEDVAPGDSVDYAFDDKGTYHVWCKYHGAMGTGMAISVTIQ